MNFYSVDYIVEFLRLFPISKIKTGRPSKFSDKWYLTQIFTVLRTGIQWRYLQTTIHYTTIFKKFAFYTKHDIFNRAYNYWLANATFNLFNPKFYVIDSTTIKNIRGIDCLGKNSCDRGRKATKVSLICTDCGIPITSLPFPANIHDSLQLVDTVKTAVINPSSVLLADKGYNSIRLKEQTEQLGISLIFPAKSNQKPNTPTITQFLKKRIIVEHVFGWFKSYKRLLLRFDSKIKHYMAFWKLASFEIFAKILKL